MNLKILATFILAVITFNGISYAKDPESVRIAVMQNANNVPFHTTDNMIKVIEGNGKKHKITKNTSFVIREENGMVNMSGNMLVSPVYFSVVKKKGNIEINGKKFIGDIKVNVSSSGKLDIIEVLPMEKYLMGVIRREMSPKWPLEALKAQAVAARSYAYANLRPTQPYDLTADVRSQVYAGIENPEENVVKAVEKTENIVLKDDDKVLIAYFHSHCGGMTETPDNVWENYRTKRVPVPSPFKKPVEDKYCAKAAPAEHKSWSISIPDSTILSLAKKKNSKVKKVSKLAKINKDKSGRAISINATTNTKTVKIDVKELREAVGATKFKSSFITGISRNKSGWTIKGKGYGHGVGMCQWGAKAMADSDKDYKQILKHYYPGAKIEKY